MYNMAKRGLGKGLDSIFASGSIVSKRKENEKLVKTDLKKEKNIKNPSDEKEKKNKLTTGLRTMSLSLIQPNLNQPRKDFDEEKLIELSESIKNYGVLQPLIIKKEGPLYEIVAGERRWRAAKLAGLKEVPVIIRDIDERESCEISIIENIQRSDLNPVEEALAYKTLIEEYKLKQEELAIRVSKSRSAITNSLRLLKLDDEILEKLKAGKITQGHARALLSIDDKDLRLEIASKCEEKNLSVREIENIVKFAKLSKNKKEKDPDEIRELKRLRIIYKDLERKMKSKLDTKVSILPKDKNKGVLEIEYYSQEELDRLYLMINSIEND